MAVAFDSVGVGGTAHSTSGVSWAHTLGGSATALLVGIGGYYNTSSGYSSLTTHTVMVGTTPLTLLGIMNCSNAVGHGWVELWGLIGPPTGAQTITVNEQVSGVACYLYGDSVSYTGCGQFGTAVLNSGTNTTQTSGAIVSATGNMVISAQGVYDQTMTISGTGTSRYKAPASGTTNYVTLLVQDITGATTATLTSTNGGYSSTPWGTVSINLVAGTGWTGGASLALTTTVNRGLAASFPMSFPFLLGAVGPSGNVAWIGGASLALTANVMSGSDSAFTMNFPFVFGGIGPSGARLILGPPLRYVGRYPDSDAVIVPASYAQTANAATAVTLNWIDSQVTNAAANLVNNAWVNQQVASYATQSQVSAALASYVPNTALDAASGIAQLGPDEEVPADSLPVLITNSLAVNYDAVAVGTVYLASGNTYTVSSTNLGAYLIASVNIPDPGYPWVALPFAYVQGYAGGAASGSRLSGNGNSGLLTVTLPITTGTPVVYAAGLMTDDTLPNYYQCVPFGSATGSMTPLTQPPIIGPATLQLSASCWTGNSYVVSGTGLVFYCLVLPAQGG